MGLLAERSRHGYELRAAFEAVVGGARNWEVKPSQVYTTLARLERAGLIEERSVEKEGGPEKRIYALTPSGREELKSWLLTGTETEPTRDEFYVKLMVGIATGQVNPRTIIQNEREALDEKLHAVTALRQVSDPQRHLAQILLLDKAAMHLEADLRWLEMIEARIDDVRRQPLPRPEPRPRGRPPRAGRGLRRA